MPAPTGKTKRCDTTPARLPDGGGAEALADYARAIGHPARVRILQMLIARDACVCGDIVDRMPLAQSTVSQHLKILKESGLVQGEIDGPKTCYCINPEALDTFKRLVASL